MIKVSSANTWDFFKTWSKMIQKYNISAKTCKKKRRETTIISHSRGSVAVSSRFPIIHIKSSCHVDNPVL